MRQKNGNTSQNVADITVRTRAEKEFGKMKKEDPGGSLFASSTKNFVVAIPLMNRERPVPMNPDFKRSARAEYAVRYLEEIGANPTSENIALVEQHVSIDKNCKAQAAWKSRGSVADYLYLSPIWADPVNGSIGKATDEKKEVLKDIKSRKDYDVFDFAIVDSTLSRYEEDRRRKVDSQNPVRGKNLSFAGFHHNGKSLSETIAFLEESFDKEEKQEISDDEYSMDVKLRYHSFAAIQEYQYDLDCFTSQKTRIEKVRLEKIRATEKRLVLLEKKKATSESEKHIKGLFASDLQIFPNRVVIKPSLNQPTSVILSPAQKSEVSKSARDELGQPMHVRVESDGEVVRKVLKIVLKLIPRTQFSDWKRVVNQMVTEKVIDLIKIAARYVFRAIIMDTLSSWNVEWASSSPTQSFHKRGAGKITKQPTTTDGSPAILSRQPSLGQRKIIDPTSSFSSRTTTNSKRQSIATSAEEESLVLRSLFVSSFRDIRDGILKASGHAMSEEMPCLLFVVRACVDALVCSYFPKTSSTINVILEEHMHCSKSTVNTNKSIRDCDDRLNDERKSNYQSSSCQLRSRFSIVYQQVDELLCEVLDPGFYLRRSSLLVPPGKPAPSRNPGSGLFTTTIDASKK